MVTASARAPARAFKNADFTFYTGKDYFNDLRARIVKLSAGDRVTMMTMTFLAQDPEIAALMDALHTALRRGASVTLVVDAHDFIAGPHMLPGPLLFSGRLPAFMPAFFKRNLRALQQLQQSGGRYAIINIPDRPLTPAIIGRSHIKHTVINDRVYLGGCNLDKSDKLDMMVGFESTHLAGQLLTLTERVIETGSVRRALQGEDQVITLDGKTRVLIDAGVRRQSLILSEALKVIDEAADFVMMTCQFFPNQTTLDHLNRAWHRNVNVELVFNAPGKHDFPWNVVHSTVLRAESRHLPPELVLGKLSKRNKYMHAKLLTSDKCVIIGSHNYVQAGVDFGTAEIAFMRDDPELAKLATRIMKAQLT